MEVFSSHLNHISTVFQAIPEQSRKGLILYKTDHDIFLTAIVVNEEFYSGLPKHLREILRAALEQGALWERKASIEQAEDNRKLLETMGLPFTELPPASKEFLRKKAAETATVFASQVVGTASLMKQIAATPAGAKEPL